MSEPMSERPLERAPGPEPTASEPEPAAPGPALAVPDFDPIAIRAVLSAKRLGGEIRVVARTTSTMDYLVELARDGAAEGTVVIADEQTAGRGRQGRSWLAAPGSALLLSVLFRPALPPLAGSQVSMAVALGALETVRRHLPTTIPSALKWPNDLLADGQKIGGLLAEARWTPGAPGEVVVGIGLNVRQDAADLPPGATSFVALGLAPPERAALAGDLLSATDRHYDALLAGLSLHEAWAAQLDTIGQEITARRADGVMHGRAIGVAPDGGLVVRTARGDTVTLYAADVTLSSEKPER